MSLACPTPGAVDAVEDACTRGSLQGRGGKVTESSGTNQSCRSGKNRTCHVNTHVIRYARACSADFDTDSYTPRRPRLASPHPPSSSLRLHIHSLSGIPVIRAPPTTHELIAPSSAFILVTHTPHFLHPPFLPSPSLLLRFMVATPLNLANRWFSLPRAPSHWNSQECPIGHNLPIDHQLSPRFPSARRHPRPFSHPSYRDS